MKQPLKWIVVLLAVLLTMPAGMKGQAYRMDIGLLGGTSSYMGDANSGKPFASPEAVYGLVGRYNLNGRLALKASLLSGGVSGTTVGDAGAYFRGEEVLFDRRFLDAGVQMEIGFYEYGVPSYQPGASRISPYFSVGIGMTGYRTNVNKVCAHIPFGLGVKAKILPRLNLGCEWMFRKTYADDLDYTPAPGGFILDNSQWNAGAWNKNKDWYSVLMVYLTYDLYGTGNECYK